MRLSERSLRNPAAVAAAAAIVVLFGMLALLRLPIQLLPDTRQPELFVSASWREAAPNELEEALIEPIEEAMRGLPGLVDMRSEANRGQGGVGLSFEVGTDMTRVMLDVVSRLNTLPPLPPDADEPQVFGAMLVHPFNEQVRVERESLEELMCRGGQQSLERRQDRRLGGCRNHGLGSRAHVADVARQLESHVRQPERIGISRHELDTDRLIELMREPAQPGSAQRLIGLGPQQAREDRAGDPATGLREIAQQAESPLELQRDRLPVERQFRIGRE